jgi:hypothetical protein
VGARDRAVLDTSEPGRSSRCSRRGVRRRS